MKHFETKAEAFLAGKIAARAVELAKKYDIKYEHMDAVMDLEACHCNGIPLDLTRLLKAKDSDFGHDVFGIRRYVDRDTGKVSKNFVPRCAGQMKTKAPPKRSCEKSTAQQYVEARDAARAAAKRARPAYLELLAAAKSAMTLLGNGTWRDKNMRLGEYENLKAAIDAAEGRGE